MKITGVWKIEILDWLWLVKEIKDYYTKNRKHWTKEVRTLWLTPTALWMWENWKNKRISWETEDKLKTLDIDLSKYLKS